MHPDETREQKIKEFWGKNKGDIQNEIEAQTLEHSRINEELTQVNAKLAGLQFVKNNVPEIKK